MSPANWYVVPGRSRRTHRTHLVHDRDGRAFIDRDYETALCGIHVLKAYHPPDVDPTDGACGSCVTLARQKDMPVVVTYPPYGTANIRQQREPSMSAIDRYPTDDHGCVLCPLCDPPPRNWYLAQDCEEGWRGLFVVMEYDVPLTRERRPGPFRNPGPDQATTSAWKVQCVNGHVLAVSQGEETAEPFREDVLPSPPPQRIDLTMLHDHLTSRHGLTYHGDRGTLPSREEAERWHHLEHHGPDADPGHDHE